MNKFIIETSTVHQLKSTVNVFFDTPRDEKSRQVILSGIAYIPYYDDKQLLVTARAAGAKSTYSTKILFNDVKFVEPETRYAVPVITTGDKIFIMPIKKNKSEVLVSCTCLDFYFMFSVWNQRDVSLLGDAPKPYIKKTDSPLRNPQRVPGVCKHILRLSDTIIGQRILK